MLIVFAGLSGTGKSTIARTLAGEIGAVWLRINSIEQGIRDSGVVPASIDDAGYRAAYAVAEDNLRLGLTVISDSVNDWLIVRDAWREAGLRAGARVVEVEIICSDIEEHRRRVAERSSDVPGLILPNWEETISRDYHPWEREHVVIDTSGRSVEECVAQIRAVLNPPDHIETKRCRLARLECADREGVAALYRCEETRRYLGGALGEGASAYRILHLLADKDAKHWTIRTREAQDFVGLASLSRHHDGPDLEISFQFLPAFWGQGLARETIGALLEYSSKTLKLPKLLAKTQAANLRSRRLLERLGMTPLRTTMRFGAEQIIYATTFSGG